MSNKQKICHKCDVKKELTKFITSSSSNDGYRNLCKECHNARVRSKNHSRKKHGLKTCSKCKIEKSVKDFWSDKAKTDGLQSIFILCKSLPTKYENNDDMSKKCKICDMVLTLDKYTKSKTGSSEISSS